MSVEIALIAIQALTYVRSRTQRTGAVITQRVAVILCVPTITRRSVTTTLISSGATRQRHHHHHPQKNRLPVWFCCDGPSGREKSPAKPAKDIKPARSAGESTRSLIPMAAFRRRALLCASVLGASFLEAEAGDGCANGVAPTLGFFAGYNYTTCIDVVGPNGQVIDIYDAPEQFFTDTNGLCSAATEDYPCCRMEWDPKLDPSSPPQVHEYSCFSGPEFWGYLDDNGNDIHTEFECTDTISRETLSWSELLDYPHRMYSVNCFPAPPAEDSGLSAGATAGIVVGGILGPFALGLAYKTLT